MPSGTMANLIAIMSHCEARGCEMILGSLNHIVVYEQGGAASIAGVMPRVIPTQVTLKNLRMMVPRWFSRRVV